VLASYNPFGLTSPYTGDGPVFVHEDGCAPFQPVPDAVSEQVSGRVLSVRAYDRDAMMTDVHFAGPGCVAFRVDRA
jgi:uncharacterized protein DUF1203